MKLLASAVLNRIMWSGVWLLQYHPAIECLTPMASRSFSMKKVEFVEGVGLLVSASSSELSD